MSHNHYSDLISQSKSEKAIKNSIIYQFPKVHF